MPLINVVPVIWRRAIKVRNCYCNYGGGDAVESSNYREKGWCSTKLTVSVVGVPHGTATSTSSSSSDFQCHCTASSSKEKEDDPLNEILHALELANIHRSWYQNDGQLVAFGSLPYM